MTSTFQRFNAAWNSFDKLYRKARREQDYSGYNNKDKRSDLGPHFWSEQDIVLHLSQLLQREFGNFWIHNELSVAHHTFENFDSESDKRSIDIVISNPSTYKQNWRKTHDAFVEVKWINKGKIFGDTQKLVKNSERDCEKLKEHIQKERCREAYFCLVDDDPLKSKIEKKTCEKWESEYRPVKVFLLQYTKNKN